MDALQEDDDGWTLRVPELTVSRCFVDWGAFGLVLHGSGGEHSIEIQMSGPLALQRADQSVERFDVDDVGSLAPLLGLLRAPVSELRITKASTLEVRFRDHSLLKNDPAMEYEAWEIHGPEPLMIFCPAGGGEPSIFG